MARYRDSVCRLCRREGAKLFLKGSRCYTEQCAFERRPYAPGHVGANRRRKKMSEYGLQLREKQKVRRIYGVLERQFRGYYHRATRRKGITGQLVLMMLETRLDNVIYRLGLASSRAQSRMLVKHGHVEVNGRRVDIPSFEVRMGMEIGLRQKSKDKDAVKLALAAAEGRSVPNWLEFDKEKVIGKVVGSPTREDIDIPIQEQLIVELYSK